MLFKAKGTGKKLRGNERMNNETRAFLRIERSFGSFSRSVTLPCEVKEEEIEATLKDGILNLKVPKAESSKKSSIKIDVKQIWKGGQSSRILL